MAKKKKAKINKKENLRNISEKLDLILKEQKKLEQKEEEAIKEERIVSSQEMEELQEEKKLERAEEKELSELEKLEKIEHEIKQRVVAHPLKRITIKDIARGSVGALFGAVAHYTFIYGVEVAERITFSRAAFLFFFSFFIGVIFLYMTGFRKIKDPKVLVFLPIRLIVLYITAIVMSTVVLWFFQPGFGHTFEEGFKQVSTVTLTAIIGACTADLVGKE